MTSGDRAKRPPRQGQGGVPEESVGAILQRGGEELVLRKARDRFTLCLASGQTELPPQIPAICDQKIPRTQLVEVVVQPERLEEAIATARSLDSVVFASHGGNVRFGNAIQYQLKVFSETALEDLSIGSSVYTLAGTCIGTLFAPKKFAIAPHQELTLSLSIESPNLAPGSYYSAFSIGQGDYSNTRYDFDIVVGYPSFQILSISSQNSQISNWHANWGNIVFQNTTLTLDRHNSDLPTSS